MKLKTILTQKFEKEKQWIKSLVNTLLLLIILTRLLSATSGGISIIFFASVIGALAGTASSSFTLVFSLKTGIIKKSYR